MHPTAQCCGSGREKAAPAVQHVLSYPVFFFNLQQEKSVFKQIAIVRVGL